MPNPQAAAMRKAFAVADKGWAEYLGVDRDSLEVRLNKKIMFGFGFALDL